MKLTTRPLAIPDVLLLEHEVFEDARGFFMEVYKRDAFRDLGLPEQFSQLNHSRSARNVIRGLHFQWDCPMGKLMRVTEGEAFRWPVKDPILSDKDARTQSLHEWLARPESKMFIVQ